MTIIVFLSENNIRINLKQGSATSGLVEVYRDNTWGVVCDDRFTMVDASVACKQLGYETAVSFETLPDTGRVNYHVDGVECTSEDRRIQECEQDTVHNCAANENVGITCSGGGKEILLVCLFA